MAKSVEITTSQNVTIEYELARLRERIFAWLLDVLMIGIFTGVFIIFFSIFLGALDKIESWGRFLSLIFFFFFMLYFILMETLNNGRTIGKLAMSVKTVRLDGKDPVWNDFILRHFMQVVDVLSSFGFLAALLIKTTPKGQRLGDMAAGTTVIKIQGLSGRFTLRDILSIASVQNYTPVYPQVRTLAESDMIFIKNALTRYQKYPNDAHREVLRTLTGHLMVVLNIEDWPSNYPEFLKTLLRDYIVLTR